MVVHATTRVVMCHAMRGGGVRTSCIAQGAKVFEAIRRQTDMLSQMQYLIKDLKVRAIPSQLHQDPDQAPDG